MTFDGSQIPQKSLSIPAPAAVWSYEECITAAAEHGYGIGFSLKNGIFGVDLDHVLDENGQLKPEYAHLSEIVDKIGSYTEISPSGEGLHIFARCDDIPQECRAGTKRGNVEMYCEGRYFTVTGNAWDYGSVLRTLSGDEYGEVHSILFGTPAPAPTTGTEKPTTPPARTAPPEPGAHVAGVFWHMPQNPERRPRSPTAPARTEPTGCKQPTDPKKCEPAG